jgi:hypothetical protein
MISVAPIVALLWENWRLTRVEAGQRLAFGILGGSGALLLSDNGVTIAFAILLLLNAFFYMSIAKLNGGKFMDGYKPGFPLYLLYTRPVPTAVLVGVTAAYDALTAAVSYLATAGLLMLVFGRPLPMLPVALLIITLHLAYICIQWSTRSRILQWVGSILIFLPAFVLFKDRLESPQQIAFSPVESALMILVCIVSFVLTVAGVARQRRGEGIASVPQQRSTGYPDWLSGLFRLACPTSSATKAQVWFELRSSGLPTLAIGLGVAMIIFLLFVIAIPVQIARPFAISAVMFSVPALLLLLGGNAFGIRRRQGRAYASPFEMTQPYGTAQLVGLKLLVRTICVLTALILAGVSVWLSSSFLGAWGSWIADGGGGKDAVPGLLKMRREFGEAFAGLTGYARAAIAVIACVAVAVTIAVLATFSAVRARYPRRLLFVGSALLGHGIVLVSLAFAGQQGIVPVFVVQTAFVATGWILLAAMVLAILYLFWRGFVDGTLTARYVSAAVAMAVAFGAASLVMLHASGLQFSGMSVAGVVGVVWPVLLPLLAGLVAPWSLGRLRQQ